MKGKKLKLKTEREECKAKEASNREAEIAMQQVQHNQQIEMNREMMEFIGPLTQKQKHRKENQNKLQR